jgi:hypothetical protein
MRFVTLAVWGLFCGTVLAGMWVPAARADSRPAWTNKEEPDASGKTLTFVGVSLPYLTEREARDDAMRNATRRVVEYMGTEAESRFVEAKTSFGLSSAVLDPTVATKSFQQQLSTNVAKKLRASEWYIEREDTSKGRTFVAFVKAVIPASSVNESFQDTAKQNQDDVQAKAQQTNDGKVKQQLDAAAKFWGNMAKSGLIPEE